MIRSREDAFPVTRSLLEVDTLDAFINIFPQELIVKVFSELSLENLSTLSSVNKKCSILIKNPQILKHIIYRDYAFNPQDWSKLGFDCQEDSDKAWQTLPEDIGRIFKKTLMFPGTTVRQSHHLIWMPVGMNMEKILKLSPCTKTSEIVKDFVDGLNVIKSEWILIAKQAIPKSVVGEIEGYVNSTTKIKLPDFSSQGFPSISEVIISKIVSFTKFQERSSFEVIACKETSDNGRLIVDWIYELGNHICCSSIHNNAGFMPVFRFKENI